jgi:PIN domain nuclease of toxin-antitoxin system
MKVLDASSLIALVKNEPGADRVERAMPQSVVSAVVMAETLSKLALLGYDAARARTDFATAGMEVVDFGEDAIASVVTLHRLARQDVSLADRICLALALDRRLPVLTADRAWARLGLPLTIELIR